MTDQSSVMVIGGMVFFWAFGPELKDVMGPLRFLLFYLPGGLAATVAQVFVDPTSTVTNLSTSGNSAFVQAIFLIVFWFITQLFSMASRYYSVQFTDPSKNTNFAYVDTRTTGTQAGDFLITGPNWPGEVPGDTTPISAPNHSVLVIGRVLVYSDSDLTTAYDLAQQIRLTAFSGGS